MKKIIISCIIVITIIAFFYSVISAANNKISMRQAARAAGAMPYQIGLTNSIIIPCFTTAIPPVCEGGTLCFTLDVGRCALYSDVSGTPAGGMGSMALFQKTAIAMAGLMPGGQLIAGGMGMTLMDSGVLASAGGCYGCMAKANMLDKIGGVYDYIIASFRDDPK